MEKKIQKYEKLRLGKNSKGKAFGVYFSKYSACDINKEADFYALLDYICEQQALTPITKTSWRVIGFEEAAKLILDGLQFSLAYNSRLLSKIEAEKIQSKIIVPFRQQTIYCLCNWNGNPWDKRGYSWTSITEQTFDLGIVLANQKQLRLVCFTGED